MLLAFSPAAGGGGATGRGASPPDSASLVRDVQRAQRNFEDLRRSLLPLVSDEGRGPCDERIGRFCYWYSPYGEAPPEPPAIAAARLRLLERLGDAGRRLPGDDWIASQRVRYLVEHGWVDSALAVAGGCAGTAWWCDALEGFARHAAQDYEAADSAFARALAGMPLPDRCQWTDLDLLLGSEGGAYHALSCADREAANRWIWWLAQPRFSRQGNDLRTEHYARQVMARMLEHAAWPHRLPWDWDVRDLVVRYGWPSSWSRASQLPGSMLTPPVLGYDRSPSYWFFALPVRWQPEDSVLAGVGWNPSPRRPPARYSPVYMRAFGSIEHAQLARFRRGGGVVTVAVFSLSGDTVLGGRLPKVTLAAGRNPATPILVGPAVNAASGMVTVQAPWSPRILSLEALVPEAAGLARLRLAAIDDESQPLNGFGVSDLMLFLPVPERPLPESLDAALGLALASVSVPPGARVGLFWEVYGLGDRDTQVEVQVRVLRLGSGRKRPNPVGRWACPSRAAAPVVLQWNGLAGPGAGGGRSVVLDLARLKTGRYVIGVRVAAESGDSVCASREMEIGERPGAVNPAQGEPPEPDVAGSAWRQRRKAGW